jgi:hypothetical protein
MEEQNKIDEFELSFNFRNILYIAQVSMMEDDSGPYYNIVYFSPNEKGEIPILKSGKSKDDEWTEKGTVHERAFIREIARQINLRTASAQ